MSYEHTLIKLAARKRLKKMKIPPPKKPATIIIARPGEPPIDIPIKTVVRTGNIVSKILHMD